MLSVIASTFYNPSCWIEKKVIQASISRIKSERFLPQLDLSDAFG